ncbi:hypothetical protein OPV22_032727 [Ensete ventricosum]|uniref:BAR domain-containing protein n=1 Tax=Ensete ventricosum TaxID=4639 RepID=A0AAV8P2K1_ENSVE|nr:hypothetical protein OPV22_032727 [Ensete ventricosum]
MKSPLRMFRGLKHQGHEANEGKKQHRSRTNLDELVQNAQDLQDLKSCYNSILSAAATTANNAHEFSEALEELGTCLLEKTALNDDEDSGRALMMMGKAQFKLQKLFDVYRVHILQTMDKPSRSLLRELEVVEEMKRLCDAKREIYKNSLEAHRGKWMSRYSKSGSFSSKELQEAQVNYEEEANMFMFRLKSLKKGQFQSLLTQATRHHAAQLSFFRKGLEMLEMVESHVKAVAERHHIAYQFSDLEGDVSDYDDDDYDYGGSDSGDLSFAYQKNFQGKNAIYTSQNSIEESTNKSQLDMLSFSCRPGFSSQSAPIFADKKIDLTEKTETPHLSTRKFHSYVLPTPDSDRNPESKPGTAPCVEKNDGSPPLWNSSPLEAKIPVKDFRERELSSPTKSFKNSVVRGSNINGEPISMPSYFSEKLSIPQINHKPAYDTNNFRRQAFSGPLTSKRLSSKPIVYAPDYRSSVEFPPVGSSTSQHVFKPQSSPPHKVTHRTSPPPVSYPKISELHELPRPPVGSEKSTGPSTLIGYSGPLISRSKVFNARKKKWELLKSRLCDPCSKGYLYGLLFAFGQLRDFFRKIIDWSNSTSKGLKGYAPICLGLEDFYTRRLYLRIQNCFSRPIASAPDAWVDVVDRYSNDNNKTLHPLKLAEDFRLFLIISAAGPQIPPSASTWDHIIYLGFATADEYCTPRVIESLKKYSSSTCSIRVDGGTTDLHTELEELVSRFVGKPAAITFGIGYVTNSAIIPSLIGKTPPSHLEEVLREQIAEGQPRTHRHTLT